MMRQKAATFYYKLIESIPKEVRLRLAATPLINLYRRISTLIGKNVPEGFQIIQSGPLRGRLLYVGPGSSRGYSSVLEYLAGNYEPDLAKSILENSQPGTTVLDIGAHFGYFSLLMAQCVGTSGRCIAFEALPGNADKIIRTVDANHLNNIKVENLAISDEDGKVSFLVNPNSFMGQIADADRVDSENREQPETLVSAMTLDSYADEARLQDISLIKIDVEGAERRVLHGGMKTIHDQRPVLVVEVHTFQPAEDHAKPFLADLLKLDYRIYYQANLMPVNLATFAGGHIIALPTER